MGVDIKVHLADGLDLIAGVGDGVGHFAAGIGAGGEQLDDVQGRGDEAAGVYLVAGERSLGDGVVELRNGGALAEVAGEHGGGGDIGDGVGWGGADSGLLRAAEEKYLVMDERTADGAAELVALQGILCGAEVAFSVDGTVAEELKGGSVNLVGAGLGDGIDDGAGVKTKSGRDAAGLDGELLQRVREGEGHVDVGVRVVVVAAVEDIVVAVDLAAHDGDTEGGLVVVAGNDAGGCVGRRGGAAGEGDEVGGLAAIQGKIDDAFGVDGLGDGGVLGLDHGGVGVDLDLLRDGAETDFDVNFDVAADGEDDAGLLIGVEAGGGDLDGVGSADGQAGEGVGTVGTADGFLGVASVELGGFDLGA